MESLKSTRAAARAPRASIAAVLACALGLAAVPAAPPAGAAVAAGAGVPIVATGRLLIPDVTLIDQDGRPRRFWSDLLRGNVVAVSFVFTTCTTICPPLGANYARLRTLLGSRAGAGVELVSVSIDPETDTPARLKAWAAKFGAGPGWTLLTGAREDVDLLLRALEVYTPNFRDHSPLILVGNAATGTWQRISGLAPAAEIAAQLARLGAPGPASKAGGAPR